MPPQDFEFKRGTGKGRTGSDFQISLENFKLPKVRIGWILIALFAVWLLTGFFMVSPGEQGVVRRFGAYVRSADPGLRYHLPYPVETVDKVSLSEIRRLEVGYRTFKDGSTRGVPQESLMLTGDENIVDVTIIIQYRVRDAMHYLFNVRDQIETIRDATESALRQVIGRHSIDDVLTTGKQQVQQETRDELQGLLDSYGIGINVTAVQLQDVHPPRQVVHAFKDVASAKEDKNKLVNQAEAYRNDVLPKARGEAAQVVQRAEGYKQERIKRAEGDVQKFVKTLDKYRMAKDITRKRLYIETMQQALPRAKKLILTDGGQVSLLNLLSNDLQMPAVRGTTRSRK
ncbi:FtsH protease activity modulator HflK [bacterium]|nr:FtsH protease activity modulator HflK [bacterium]